MRCRLLRVFVPQLRAFGVQLGGLPIQLHTCLLQRTRVRRGEGRARRRRLGAAHTDLQTVVCPGNRSSGVSELLFQAPPRGFPRALVTASRLLGALNIAPGKSFWDDFSSLSSSRG